jgi:hypothetical protein
VFTRFIFWPWFAGLIYLLAGLFAVRTKLAAARGLEKLVVSGPVFFATPLAVFAGEHLAGAQFLKELVPAWMPGRLFWAYFVGIALLSAATSILFNRYVRWSAALLGVMLFLFVIMIHVPRVMASPSDRIAWTVVLRDFAFGCAAWALAGSNTPAGKASSFLITIGRYGVAIALVFFAVEQFLHPGGAPGVPLEKLTPPWIPLAAVWSFLTAMVSLITGVALLAKRNDRMACIYAGLLLTLLTLIIYGPLLPLATKPSEMNEATNYIADTLLFAGAVLVLAGALPNRKMAAQAPANTAI